MTSSANPMNRPQTLGQHPAVLNDLFNQRPGYTRPDRASDLQPGPVSAPAVNYTGTPAAVADATIRAAEHLFRQHLASIHQPDQYRPSGLRQQIANFQDTDAYQAIAPAVQAVADAADAAAAKVDDVRGGLSANGDAADEIRAQRLWARTKAELDTVKDGSALVGAAWNLVTNASDADRSTLLQELPCYLRSRGSISNFLDAAVENSVPELAAAQSDSRQANKLRDKVIYNAKLLTDRVSQTQSPNGYRPPNFVPLTADR